MDPLGPTDPNDALAMTHWPPDPVSQDVARRLQQTGKNLWNTWLGPAERLGKATTSGTLNVTDPATAGAGLQLAGSVAGARAPFARAGELGAVGGKAPTARIASSPEMREALLRNEWMRNGPSLDYDDIPQATFVKEARAWNRTHDFSQQVDPESYKGGSVPAFEKMFEEKYLNGRTKPWPGAKKANQWFVENEPDRAVYLSKDEAFQTLKDYYSK
jgi:hypothetical protein